MIITDIPIINNAVEIAHEYLNALHTIFEKQNRKIKNKYFYQFLLYFNDDTAVLKLRAVHLLTCLGDFTNKFSLCDFKFLR